MKYASLELGTIEAVFNKLGGIKGAQRFLRGDSDVVTTKHIIDTDADPFVPNGWKVEEHISSGTLEWNPDDVGLYLSGWQRDGRVVGQELRTELRGKNALNANVLDYLLKNPQLIPDDWKGKWVFFWGTIYRDSFDFLYVRCLNWFGDRWDWYYCWLVSGFPDNSPAAVLASN